MLALAVSNRPAEDGTLSAEELGRDLVLLGLVGLIDPPRPEAVAAIVECQRAGIRVKMITGDHAGTAAAIAGRIGLTNPERVMTGTELDAVDEAELAAIVVDTDVFARTSPEHKLRLVSALQSHGLTVAMTGDGGQRCAGPQARRCGHRDGPQGKRCGARNRRPGSGRRQFRLDRGGGARGAHGL